MIGGTELSQWLDKVNLKKYEKAFTDAGYDFDLIDNLEGDEVDEVMREVIPEKSKDDRRRFKSGVKKLQLKLVLSPRATALERAKSENDKSHFLLALASARGSTPSPPPPPPPAVAELCEKGCMNPVMPGSNLCYPGCTGSGGAPGSLYPEKYGFCNQGCGFTAEGGWYGQCRACWAAAPPAAISGGGRGRRRRKKHISRKKNKSRTKRRNKSKRKKKSGIKRRRRIR